MRIRSSAGDMRRCNRSRRPAIATPRSCRRSGTFTRKIINGLFGDQCGRHRYHPRNQLPGNHQGHGRGQPGLEHICRITWPITGSPGSGSTASIRAARWAWCCAGKPHPVGRFESDDRAAARICRRSLNGLMRARTDGRRLQVTGFVAIVMANYISEETAMHSDPEINRTDQRRWRCAATPAPAKSVALYSPSASITGNRSSWSTVSTAVPIRRSRFSPNSTICRDET